MFERAFKNIDDILHKDASNSSELDYTEQTSWILFLKYLGALEQDKAMEAELEGRPYRFILDREIYRWEHWAAPKTADGKLDHNSGMIGDDLKDFVDHQLFPYLRAVGLMSDSRFGLSPETLAAITSCLRGYPDIRWARIYGSRAKGTFGRGSDIDIAFSSPIDCTADLREALDDLPTPCLFDVTHYESLKHEGLKSHIDRVGVVFYEREEQKG